MKHKLRLFLLILMIACILPCISIQSNATSDAQGSDSIEMLPVTDETQNDVNGFYYDFSTFEELEELVERYTSTYNTFTYTGSDDLVIARSLTLPEGTKIKAQNSTVIIPQDVSFNIPYGELRALNLQLDGQLNAGYVQIYHSLTIDGTLNVSYLYFYNVYSFSGQENIQGEDYHIFCTFNPTTEAELYNALDWIYATTDERFSFDIYQNGESFVIDRDITIPANTSACFTDYNNSTFTLKSGYTITVDGIAVFSNSTIYGTIVNNNYITVISSNKFMDKTSYQGDGYIKASSPTVSWDAPYVDYLKYAIQGLDLSQFKITYKYHDDPSYFYGYTLYPRECMPHSFSGGICSKCGYDRNVYNANRVDGTVRLAGATRVETALKSADLLKEVLGVERFDNIIVANAKNYPDALAGSYLAAALKAPILLTMDGYHDIIRDYIYDNLSTDGTIYILGGYTAVPDAFMQYLWDRYYVRLSGTDRFDTNLKILNSVGMENEPLLVCTAYGFADSLSISATGYPVLLVGKTLTAAQKEFLNNANINDVYIIGGTAAVSAEIEHEMNQYSTSVTRLAGKNRYETSVLVAEEFFSGSYRAVLAYSENFPDGLSGGPLAYAQRSPLLLTKSGNYICEAYCDEYYVSGGCVMGSAELIDDVTAQRLLNSYQITVR